MEAFNELIPVGIFPDNMKTAKLMPVFQSGKIKLLTNYRSISVCYHAFPKYYEKLCATDCLDI